MKREDYSKLAREIKRNLVKLLKQDKYRSGTIVCRHNTILALKRVKTQEIEFIVNTDEKRNLISMFDAMKALYAPRYEPTTAREWMKEELVVNGLYQDEEDFKMEKCTLSERELKDLVIKELKGQYETFKKLAVVMSQKGIEEF